MERRVVITGVGAVTPVGNTADKTWDSILAGRHGISLIQSFDTASSEVKVAAEVRDFDPLEYMDKKEARRSDRYTQFALAAAVQAVQDCGTDFSGEDPYRIGVIVGSGIGGFQTIEKEYSGYLDKGMRHISALFIPMMITNMAAGTISMRYGFKGPNYAPVSACATSAHAVGEAFRSIKHGYCDVCLTGGSEAAITQFAIGGFNNMKALTQSEDPDRACCPFDKERSGFVMGEGGAILVLEELEHAKARGAVILGEVLGYGATCDAYHITAPAPGGEGAARCMREAIADAGLTPGEIGYINAHGTSTPMNDRTETQAIRAVFGEAAPPTSSTKSMTGHLLGASGAVEAIFTAMALRDGFLPATINYQVPDPECDLDIIPNTGRQAEIRAAMSNSLGFGGHNVSLVFGKYKEG